ncbi:MAG: sulfate adenylyltransferase, partial [Candidatus Abyssubacteria bacterium]|nr:sulfate adenylyltransferase [Candidatus Abyssubacteria bacterium]
MIRPHGGKLVNRFVEGNEREELEERVPNMPALRLNAREMSDLEMIATGAMSPLEGFMTQEDYISVLDLMRLASGLPWSIPVVLAVKEGDGSQYRLDSDVALCDCQKNLLGVLHLEDKYELDREKEASAVLQTTDEA